MEKRTKKDCIRFGKKMEMFLSLIHQLTNKTKHNGHNNLSLDESRQHQQQRIA